MTDVAVIRKRLEYLKKYADDELNRLSMELPGDEPINYFVNTSLDKQESFYNSINILKAEEEKSFLKRSKALKK